MHLTSGLITASPLIHEAAALATSPSSSNFRLLLSSATKSSSIVTPASTNNTTKQPKPKRRHRRSNSFDSACLSRSFEIKHGPSSIEESSALGLVKAIVALSGQQLLSWLKCDWEQQCLPDDGIRQLHTPSDSLLSRPGHIGQCRQGRGAFRRGMLSPLLILLTMGIARCLLESRLRHGPLAGNPLSCLAVGGGPICLVGVACLAFAALNASLLVATAGYRRLGVATSACLLLVAPACVALWARPSPIVSLAAMSISVALFLKLASFHSESPSDSKRRLSLLELCRFAASSRLLFSKPSRPMTLSSSSATILLAQLAGLLATMIGLNQQWLLPSLAAADNYRPVAGESSTACYWLVMIERQLRLSAPVIAVCLAAGSAVNRFFCLIDACSLASPAKDGDNAVPDQQQQQPPTVWWWNSASLSDLPQAIWPACADLQLPRLAWACLVQLVISVALRSPRLWPLLTILVAMPALDKLCAKLGNAFVWLCLVLGLPVLARLAYADYCQYYL